MGPDLGEVLLLQVRSAVHSFKSPRAILTDAVELVKGFTPRQLMDGRIENVAICAIIVPTSRYNDALMKEY